MARNCIECGCTCKRCLATSDHDVHLHLEIENLKHQLVENRKHMVEMESHFLREADETPDPELTNLREELTTWQEKYQRLYEAHARIQRVNQGLEDKLLKLVDTNETEKTTLIKDVAILSKRLAEANYAVKRLSTDNERYKSDVSVAIQFLQCKQANFVAHKFDSLSQDVQTQVSSFMGTKYKTESRKNHHEGKSIKVPIPTFPPTAMVYSVPKNPSNENRRLLEMEIPKDTADDIVSAAIMAKVLEERLKEKITKHCNTCTCPKEIDDLIYHSTETIETQTEVVQSKNDSTQTQKKPQKHKVRKLSCEEAQCQPGNGNNVAKVQPNNFLMDDKTYQDPHMHERIDNLLINHAKESATNPNSSNDSPKNLLLDNVHRNIHPVLLTHANETKTSIKPKAVLHIQPTSSFSNTPNQSKIVTKVNVQTQSKVQSESAHSQRDANYEEMEENVKKFLFKERSFLKAMDSQVKDSNKYNASQTRTHQDGNKSASSIETEI